MQYLSSLLHCVRDLSIYLASHNYCVVQINRIVANHTLLHFSRVPLMAETDTQILFNELAAVS